jgi:PKHD-type hydroxylase
MIMQIENVLTANAVAELREALQAEASAFKPGAATAGWHARDVKRNEQAAGPAAIKAVKDVQAALLANSVFKAVARPKQLTGWLVSRYGPGMEYGLHIDDALMGGIRTDLSFTVFVAEPGSYEGGELLIEGNDGTSSIKLPAGSAVVYPTTSLHRVAPVTAGERLVVVGWVRSYIRNGEQREILFDLDHSVTQLREAGAARPILDRILKTRANLMRMWAED